MQEHLQPPRPGDPTPLPPERARLEVELERCRRARRRAALMTLAMTPPAPADPPADLEVRARAALERALWRILEPAETFVWRTPERIHVLVANGGMEHAAELAEALVEAGRHLELDGFERPLRAHVAVGLALDEPERDWWFDTLLAVADEGLELARARGGEGAAHTELYTLCQRRVERAGPRRRASIPAELEPRATAPKPTPAPRAEPARPAPESRAPAPLPDHAPEPFALDELLAERERAHREEVERLERRVAKLIASLESTERELHALARRAQIDPGLASVYREVQGLASEDERYEVKAALMERILEANLELREVLRARRELAG